MKYGFKQLQSDKRAIINQGSEFNEHVFIFFAKEIPVFGKGNFTTLKNIDLTFDLTKR
ncbi:hypothetical protein ATK78_2443 [Pedobacter metabolipauper]|uniref:Uncharacterized protein n=1 Tax=Pedobacter metabolipauper TaxID=425513 RepID=A0A4V6PW19_9SPHI|nr:hypothetical protein ATK78_2443 [Pedobacter metabolipauper]